MTFDTSIEVKPFRYAEIPSEDFSCSGSSLSRSDENRTSNHAHSSPMPLKGLPSIASLQRHPQIVAVLHNIRSTHNVGSMFRTADAAGMERLYLCGITPDPIDRFGREVSKISKVALGAEKTVSWKHYASTARCVAFLKKQGYRVLAIERNRNSVLYTSVSIHNGEKVALVFGNEVEGLPDSILGKADAILEIPMHGNKESLNVAVAFGIAAYGIMPVSSRAK